MATYLKRALSGDFTVLSGPAPPDDLGFQSDRLQILWNDADEPWTDSRHHLHTNSDEAYIALNGAIVLEIEDERVTVSTGEVCFVPPGVVHAVVQPERPVQALVIRASASHDKEYRDTC
jgi:mannose-6-phosphate isomerase-like protein (cupin superfamily)